MAAAPPDVGLELTTDYTTIKRAAEFFASEFWSWSEELSEAQRSTLADQHRADFDSRYGELTGKRRFPSALLLAYNADAEIIGCAGTLLAGSGVRS